MAPSGDRIHAHARKVVVRKSTGSDFDWNDLKTFLVVARTRRLTAAATKLGADHTTVGRRIASLEKDLGTVLFHRSPTGYALTEEGERLLPAAEAMEAAALGAQGELDAADGSVSGTVRIGAPEGFGSYFLAPRLCRLSDRHPELEVQLVAIPGVFSLSKREADLAVTLSAPTEGRLTARKLTDYRLGFYASADYLASNAPIQDLADLKDHRLVGYIEDLVYTPELDYLAQLGIEQPPRLKSSNLIAQLKATAAGAGVCVLPRFVAAAEPDLRPVLSEEVALTRSFWLIGHEDLRGLPRIRAAADFVAEAVRDARSVFEG